MFTHLKVCITSLLINETVKKYGLYSEYEGNSVYHDPQWGSSAPSGDLIQGSPPFPSLLRRMFVSGLQEQTLKNINPVIKEKLQIFSYKPNKYSRNKFLLSQKFPQDLIESSSNLIKREIEFMCGPWNCCNMSSCERKHRPRDPFPTIAGSNRWEKFCLQKSPDIKILLLVQYEICCLQNRCWPVSIPALVVFKGQISQLDFGCRSQIDRTENSNQQMEVWSEAQSCFNWGNFQFRHHHQS